MTHCEQPTLLLKSLDHLRRMKTRSQTQGERASAQETRISRPVAKAPRKRKSAASKASERVESSKPSSSSRRIACTVQTCAYLRDQVAMPAFSQDEASREQKEAEYASQASSAIESLISIEPRFGPLVERFGKPDFRRRDCCSSLLQAIAYQQLSGHAGKAIWTRFLDLIDVEDKIVVPCKVLGKSVEELKGVGLSRQKAQYMLNIAEFFHDGHIKENEIDDLSDEEIMERLVSIKGVGAWTVHMLLMFSLRRMNILPTGDLGVAKGANIMFGGGAKGPMKAKAMESAFERFHGLRSFATYYMWRVLNKDFKVPEFRKEE